MILRVFSMLLLMVFSMAFSMAFSIAISVALSMPLLKTRSHERVQVLESC